MDKGYTAAYDGGNQRYSPANQRQGYGQHGNTSNRNNNHQGRYDREDGPSENGGGFSDYNSSDSHRGYNRGNGNSNRGNFSRGNNYYNPTTKNDFFPYQHQDNQPSSSFSGYSRHGSESQAQRRDSFGDNRAYANKPGQQSSPETSPPTHNSSNPTDSLRAYQQERSSDSYASGVRSSAEFFNETYDKLERTEGLADRYAGTKHSVTVIKTYCEMATQTTEDVLPDIFSPDESIWNGIRITTIGRSQQQNAKRGSSTTTPAPSVANSLLQAVSTPVTPPPLSSAGNNSTSSRLERSPSEQQSYKRQGDHQTSAPSSTWGNPPKTPAAQAGHQPLAPSSSAWGDPPKIPAAQAGHQISAPSSSAWGDPPKIPAAQADHGVISPTSSSTEVLKPLWENGNSTLESNKSAPQPKSSVPAVDPWGAPPTSSSTKISSASAGGGGGGVGGAGWDDSTVKKGVADMVDWSKGVFEFPDAKPTKMVVSSGWGARNATNDPIPDTSQQQSHDSAQPRRAVDNENSGRDLSASRDPWSSGGDNGGSGYGSERHTVPSQDSGDRGRPQYRDDSQAQGPNSSYNSHGGYNNRSASASNSDSNDMYRQSAPTQDRKHMSSEDRFNNSLNRRTSANDSYNSYNTGSNDSGAGVGTGSPSYNSSGYSYSNRGGSGSGGDRGGGGSQYGQSESGSQQGGQGRGGPTTHRWSNNGSAGTNSSYQHSQDYQNRNQPQTQHPRDGSTATTSSLSNPLGRRGLGNTGAQNPAIAGWSAASKSAAPGRAYGSGGGLATASDFMSFVQATSVFTPPPATGRKSNAAGGSRNGSSVGGGSVHGGSTSGSRPGSPTGMDRQQSITKLEQSRGQSQDRPHSDLQQDQQQQQQQTLEPVTETHQEEPAPASDTTQGDQKTATAAKAAMVPLWPMASSDFESDWSKQVERQEEEEEKKNQGQMANDDSSSSNIESRQQPTEEPLIPGLTNSSERPVTPPGVEPESVPLPISRSSSQGDSNSQPATATVDEDNLLSLEDQSQN
ncbi:hypothetical protein BGX26_008761 [Mortierella sp. AD094]|nr:hypothetical protein BGX26_008761 [Mortierella sp. AD094]